MDASCFVLNQRKCTDGMKEFLDKLSQLLKCPLCNKVFKNPTTLASCAHSFCVSCIDSYSCDAWVCPVQGCGMPMSIVGGHGGSYRKVNPQLAQTAESLKTICSSLNKADDQWWKSQSVRETIASDLEKNDANYQDQSQHDDNGEEFDEEQMIDLQKDQNPVLDESSSDNEAEDGIDSDWE